ncbi:MAG: hypothetical protein HZB91_09290 [Elusimicrobia bacterium]|nr:hypothetical protein [Elusimicrobiota bacterium]
MKKTQKEEKKDGFDLKSAGKTGLVAAIAVLAGVAIAKALKKRSDKNTVSKLVGKLKAL